jgi:hypothetical protein
VEVEQAALITIDWLRLVRSFSRRETDWLADELDQAGIARKTVDMCFDGTRIPTEELKSTWVDALTSRGAATIIAVYVYTRCQRKWELSVAYDEVVDTLSALREAWDAIATRADPKEKLAVELMLRHADSLSACMKAENAVFCSCPVELGNQARAVVRECDAILDETAALGALEWRGFRAFLDTSLHAHRATYAALVDVAGVVLEWLKHNHSATQRVEEISQAVYEVETSKEVRDDVYASELRSHRHTLEKIAGRLRDKAVPNVLIDEAKFIYCYPFSLREYTGKGILERVRNVFSADSGPEVHRTVGSEVLGSAVDPGLSDIWSAHLYEVVAVTLPPLSILTTAGITLPEHRVELRFSSLGNHYLRIERTDANLRLHDVYQGLRRASMQMGRENIRGEGSSDWRHLPEYAKEVISSVICHLHHDHVEARTDAQHVDFQSNFHVVLEIRSASTLQDNGCRKPATSGDLVRAAGGLLLQPVQTFSASLEEWVRVSVPDPVLNLVQQTGFDTDLVVRTANTTLLFMPGSPNWVLLGFEEMAEFVAALPPLLYAWKQRLSEQKDYAVQSLRELRRMLPEEAQASEEDQQVVKSEPLLMSSLEKLEGLRVDLRDLVAEVRSELAVLKSMELCHLPVHRVFLDQLYDAAGLPRLEEELEVSIAELDAHYERALSYIALFEDRRRQREDSRRQDEDRRRRRYEIRLQGILAFLAAASLASLLSLLDSLFVPFGGSVPLIAIIIEVSVMTLAMGGTVVVTLLYGQRMAR